MIKAIETIYNGHRFRSRLEARWAVFFDTLGVAYEYEPEGFDLGDGLWYLPDFRVKCYGTRGSITEHPFDLWIEVKGHMTERDAEKIRRFAIIPPPPDFAENPVLIVGNIPEREYYNLWGAGGAYDAMDGIDIYPFNYKLIDGDYFAAYPAAHDGKFYLWGDDSNYINWEDAPRVERALDAARMARFEEAEQ